MRLLLWCVLAAATSSAGASYVDAIERQRFCRDAGGFAKFAYAEKLKQPNMFLAEKRLAKTMPNLKKAFDPESDVGKSVHGQITAAIWLEVFVRGTIKSPGDAYEYGWAVCMDKTPPD